jgi:TonB family protein
MQWTSFRAEIFALFLFLHAVTGRSQQSQSAAASQQPVAATPADSYPDNSGGLKRLAKDVLRAQKENDSARAAALLDSLVLSNHAAWYRENFDSGAVARVLPKYDVAVKSLPTQLAGFFLASQQDGPTEIEAVRFDRDCDDNANEQTFNTLDARLKAVPLYELRFLKNDHFRRLFAFAYVDGAFRFILTPDFSEPAPKRAPGGSSGGGSDDSEAVRMIRQGGAVTAALLVKKVQPRYPETARLEGLSGTVRLHAIITKDGSVRELRVMSGRCSLARASIEAVRQWRYRPTTLAGQPVEVDTTIDVIFALNNR